MIQKFIQKIDNAKIILIVSVLASLLVVDQYFAYTGVALTFILFSSLFFWHRHTVTLRSTTLYLISIVLALFLILRVNELLTFFNLTALVYCLCLIAYPNNKPHKYEFFNLIFLPFFQIIDTLKVKSKYTLKAALNFGEKVDLKPKQNIADLSNPMPATQNASNDTDATIPKNNTNNKIAGESHKIFLGILASLAVLWLIVPLLASSNPFFSQYIQNFFNIFNLNFILEFIGNIYTFVFSGYTFWRVLWFTLFWVFLSKSISALEQQEYAAPIAETFPKSNNLAWFIPKVSVIATLFSFFVSQIQFYLSSSQILMEMSYSYSRYVNEVFGQLSIVALIVFNLIFFDKFYKGKALAASVILILQGLFLLVIGLKSDLDYIIAAGLTFKRLYGLAVIIWLGSLYLIFSYSLWQKKSHAWYLRSMSFVSLFVILGINIANFDVLIYRVNPARETSGVDYTYFAELSSDAGADHEILNLTLDSLKNPDISVWKFSKIIRRAKYLQQKYAVPQFQSFNLSEYLAYQKIKNYDLKQFNGYFKDLYLE